MSGGNDKRAFTWPVVLPALSLLPGIAYTSLCYACWTGLGVPDALGLGLPIAAALSLPIALVLLLAAIPARVRPGLIFGGAFAWGALVFAHPAWVALINVYLASTDGVRACVPLFTVVVPVAVGCAYALPIWAAARATTTRAMEALETSLLASATCVVAMGAFTRLSSEAMHFHATSRTIAIAMHLGALALTFAALYASVRRRRWAAAAFDANAAGWRIAKFDEERHAALPTLGTPAGDGVLLRVASSGNVPYRSNEDAVAVARTWLDERRALRPLEKRTWLAAGLTAATVLFTPIVAGDTLAIAHLVTGGRHVATTGPLGFPAGCPRHDRIYLVQIGRLDGVDVAALAKRYTSNYGYGREFIPLKPYANDLHGGGPGSEGLIAAMRFLHEEYGGNAVVIGLTSESLGYVPSRRGRELYDLYGYRRPPIAILSTNGLHHGVRWRDDADAMVDYRLRKLITREIGFLYCGFQRSGDPKSILYDPIDNVADVDAMDEWVWQ